MDGQQRSDLDYKVPPAEEAKVDPKVFAGAQVLSNSEAAWLLHQALGTRRGEHGITNWQPPSIWQKTLDYLDKLRTTDNQESLRSMRQEFLDGGIHDPDTGDMKFLRPYEYGMLCNLMPQDYDEVVALVPSLVEIRDGQPRFTEEEVRRILDTLETFR